MSALLDTSFLFALANTTDRNHTNVLKLAHTLHDPLVLPLSVLPEICYLLASRLGHAAMRRFVQELTKGDILLEPLTVADLQP